MGASFNLLSISDWRHLGLRGHLTITHNVAFRLGLPRHVPAISPWRPSVDKRLERNPIKWLPLLASPNFVSELLRDQAKTLARGLRFHLNAAPAPRLVNTDTVIVSTLTLTNMSKLTYVFMLATAQSINDVEHVFRLTVHRHLLFN